MKLWLKSLDGSSTSLIKVIISWGDGQVKRVAKLRSGEENDNLQLLPLANLHTCF
jgi:hypothetical protein